MIILITDANAAVQSFIQEGECSCIDEAEVIDHGESRYEIRVTVSSAPRDAMELLIVSEPEYRQDITTSTSTNDNAPTDSYVRLAGTVQDHTRDDLKGIVIEPDGNLDPEDAEYPVFNLAVAGSLDTPEYSDDEADGYLYGSFYISPKGDSWAFDQSTQHLLRDLDASVPEMIRHPIKILQKMRELGRTGPIANDETSLLVREAFAA